MRQYVASWVKWWRETWASADVRKFLLLQALYLVLIGGSLAWSSHKDAVRDAQGLKLNCACRCQP